MKSDFGYNDAIAKLVYAELHYGKKARIDPKGLENVVSFLVAYRIVKKEKLPPLNELYTNKFVQ
jgi:hypothetical protein